MCLSNKNVIFLVVILCYLTEYVLCQQLMENSTTNSDANITESRTFGHHFLKRISFAMVPAAFVVGVITTLLAALTIVSMKGLGVGIILLVIALGQMLGRFIPAAAAPLSTPYQAAPIPVVYSQRQDPVWLEKTWR